jgi:hypothetical protein
MTARELAERLTDTHLKLIGLGANPSGRACCRYPALGVGTGSTARIVALLV